MPGSVCSQYATMNPGSGTVIVPENMGADDRNTGKSADQVPAGGLTARTERGRSRSIRLAAA
ncbi:hypothetical protein JCM9534A_63530 [Catenuloplanes indicus JCM 9534]